MLGGDCRLTQLTKRNVLIVTVATAAAGDFAQGGVGRGANGRVEQADEPDEQRNNRVHGQWGAVGLEMFLRS